MAHTSTRQPTHEDHREKTPTSASKPPRAFPAPRPLATPTDLSSSNVQAVAEAINPLIADAFALYVKTKNYHWHLAGPHFRDYHLLLDEHAEQIFGAIDILAERVRRIGGTTIRSVSHVAQLQTIQDDNSEFVAAGDMMRRLLDDNAHIAEQQRAAIRVCEEHGDSVTANVLEEILDETERRKWFLFEITSDMDSTR